MTEARKIQVQGQEDAGFDILEIVGTVVHTTCNVHLASECIVAVLKQEHESMISSQSVAACLYVSRFCNDIFLCFMYICGDFVYFYKFHNNLKVTFVIHRCKVDGLVLCSYEKGKYDNYV